MHNKDRALDVIEFVQMLHHTGDFYGQPFLLLDWQHQVIWDVYGTVKDNGFRQYQYAYLEIPKKNGKALAIDTPIPTPDGWKTMGQLSDGDKVFDENGKVCNVTFATEAMHGHVCYRVCFSDGTSIVADAEHNWLTNAWVDNPGNVKGKAVNSGQRSYRGTIARVRTTEEIRQTLKIQGTTNNHSVLVCGPLDLPEATLPVPPYTFGAWLGDGTSCRASIVCADKDYAIIERVIADGVPIKKYKQKNRIAEYGLTTGKRSSTERQSSIQKALRGLKVLGNKHIPSLYLRASISQRKQLLQGLMDTDGYASKAGQCEIVTISEHLCSGVIELLRSLGYKPSLNVDKAQVNGKMCGDRYRIQFWAFKNDPCFTLQRKIDRLKPDPERMTRSKNRHITDVISVESVPVKCIMVDSKSHLYLAGEAMVPTHNTELVAGIGLYHLFNDPPSGQIYCCAAEKEQAGLVYKAAKQMIEQDPALQKMVKVVDSKKEIHNLHTGTFMKVLSAEAYSKHGLNPTVVIFDELHAQPNRNLWDVMTFGAGAARMEPLWWVITTAGDDPDRHSIGWEVHEYARRLIDKEIIDPNWYAKIYCADEDDDIYDEAVWYKSNPSLGRSIDIDKVRQEAIGARNDEGKEKLFRWLRLNQWVALKTVGWLPLTLWDKTVGEWDYSELAGKKCYLGLDLASTTDLTAGALLFPPQEGLDEWRAIFDAWIPSEKMKERIKRDRVAYDKWVKDKYLHATPGDVVDYDFVKARIEAMAKQYNIAFLCTDPWNSRMLTQQLAKAEIESLEVPQTITGMSSGMKEIERLLRSGLMSHEKNPVARWCFGNMAIAMDGNENIKPMKNKSTDRIDLIVALINAMAIAITQEDNNFIYNIRGMRSLLG